MFACTLKPSPSSVAGVRDAAGTGVDRDSAPGIDDRNLAEAGLLVGGQQRLQRVARRLSLAQAVEQPRAVGGLGDRLRGHGADARQRPGDDRADREPVRLDRDAELARVGVPRHDRVGAPPHLKPTWRLFRRYASEKRQSPGSWADRDVGAEAIDLEARASDEGDRDSRAVVRATVGLGDGRRRLAVDVRAV